MSELFETVANKPEESQEMPAEMPAEEPVMDNEEADDGEMVDVESFSNYNASFSVMEFVKRLLKYLVEGLVVAIAASTIPKKKLDVQEVGVIALSAAATFALLDLFAPTISYAARQGAGFGMGANLVGFPRF